MEQAGLLFGIYRDRREGFGHETADARQCVRNLLLPFILFSRLQWPSKKGMTLAEVGSSSMMGISVHPGVPN